MANHERFYYFAPSWDFSLNGPIQLGNILSNWKTPNRIIDRVPPGESTFIDSTDKRDVQYGIEKLRNGKFSMWTKFLSLLGISVDVYAELNKRIEEFLSFKIIETKEFVPTRPYLLACINTADVLDFFRENNFREPIYIITGIKVAIGAAGRTSQGSALGGGLASQADATVWSGGSVPVSLGLDASGKKGNKVSVQWKDSSNFVFAYRMSKVSVPGVDGQGIPWSQGFHEEDYNQGAMLGDTWTDLKNLELTSFTVEGLDAEVEGFDTEVLMEDGEEVTCGILRQG